MPFIEAPTTFYLGRQYDPNTRRLIDDVVYYDSRDLTTHAVVVGMTGSGKTGLCITLLEEAALDSIPSIIIDPKGDITNLLLMFENLSPEEFRPWINVDDARRAGMSVDEYAQDVAQRWKDGLASWGIGEQRIRALKSQAEFNIFTPGSDAGLPVSIIEAMQAPRTGWQGQEEYHREQIRAITSALLALIGMSANPVKDREHVLIANIFEYAWRNGIDLTLEDIIVQVQEPPFQKLGVLDIDTFFPEKQRFKLAMELNNIIAAPSFQSWLRGEPLDMRNLMYNPQGKPRHNIFYIAHLDEAQRSFFITLLLETILASMRTMSGTTSLRSILYFDEVFGHFPPYPKNPPTKQPLLRLLKQARAFGIGLVLATQNPGDLDYKGLSNAGTWFIGRLQTENDKKKVLDGLATASTAENQLDLATLDALISSVDPRVFVMNNVHNNTGPILIHTRWAMSYLRGPLTRDQIFNLMQSRRQQMQYGTQQYAQQPGFYGQPQFGTGGYQPAQFQQQQPYAGAGQFAPAYTPPPAAPPPPALPQSNFAPPPAAPFQQNQPPAPPGGAPVPPSHLPEMFSSPAGAPPGLPESVTGRYSPQGYQPPAAPMSRDQFDNYNPATYTPPAPPVGPVNYQSNPYGGTGQYTPPPAQSTGGYGTGSVLSQTNEITGAGRDADLPQGFTRTRPALGSAVDQYFFPVIISMQQAVARWERQFGIRAQGVGSHMIAYIPFLLAQLQVRYAERKANINLVETYAYHVPDVQKTGIVHWDEYRAPAVTSRNLRMEPIEQDSAFGDVPLGLTDRTRLTALKKEIQDYIFRTAGVVVPHNPTLDIFGMPGSGFNDFRVRVNAAAREGRDAEVDRITQNYAQKFDQLEDRYRRELRELQSERDQLGELNREVMFTMGEAFVSLLRGRTSYTLSRVARARRYKGLAQEDLSESEVVLVEIENDMDQLQAQFERELAQIQEKWVSIAQQVEEQRITPYKKDIHVEVFGVGWMPQYLMTINGQPVTIQAWESRHPRGEDSPALQSGRFEDRPQGGYSDEY
ncbi:MAG: DUF87 domain-containing protein [Chloroflexi bacterium]|nr:DUF87 domain-containing protein [Chloroflexota bacterium]